MAEKDKEPLSTEDALKQWRAAERTVAVARRGRLAADFDINHSTFQLETAEHVLWEGRSAQPQH